MPVEKRSVTRLELLMDAGAGAQISGDILLSALIAMGKSVYAEPLIPAEISPLPRSEPALSGIILRLADFDITNIGNGTDLIIASHEVVLNRRLDDDEYTPEGVVLLDTSDRARNPGSYDTALKRCARKGLNVITFNVDQDSRNVLQRTGGKGQNIYYLGMLSYIFIIDENILKDEINKTFRDKLQPEVVANYITLCHNGYQLAEQLDLLRYQIDSAPRQGARVLIDGNTALSLGVIDAGFKFFSGYPITPASSIMHTLARELPAYGGHVHQAEDEIAAIGSAIGAYYGGTPSITATSGPGLSLKQEFIGFAQAAEIPIVILDVQRGGPSTGMPTRTSQSDLLAAVFGSHGDNTKIVISVANSTDCFYAPHVARYLAEKLRLPVFIMSDFQTATSYKAILKPELVELNNIEDIPDFILEHFHLKRLPLDIESVQAVQSLPGTPGGMRRITGLTTDTQGHVSSFAKASQRSHEIRNAKLRLLQHALTAPGILGADTNDLLIVGWGSTLGVLEESIAQAQEEGLNVSGLHLRFIYPLPLMLRDIFSRFKKVMSIEAAYGDTLKSPPLAFLLRGETLVNIQPLIAQATGRPIRPEMIIERVKEALK